MYADKITIGKIFVNENEIKQKTRILSRKKKYYKNKQ